jgi:hypothetical protein
MESLDYVLSALPCLASYSIHRFLVPGLSQIPSILQRLLVMRNEHNIIGDRGDHIRSGGLIVSADNRRMMVIMAG